MKVALSLSFIFLLNLVGIAQNKQVTIVGTLKDATNFTVPYATIVVKDNTNKEVLSGTTSDEKGRFNIKTKNPNFYIEISFMGYKTKTYNNLDASKNIVDLGTIVLEENSQALEAVEVRAEISKTQFKLDKKVFNVGKDIASTGVSALEVLNNVPSVNVDIEGTVSLRGSSGVQILINGKPSVLAESGSNALGTITAEMIESIEVITNPSAKYDAEGTAGILNIILKKEDKKGLNGSISVNTGIPDNHSIGVSLNRRTEKFNLFTQFGGGYKSYPRYNESITINKDSLTRLETEGTSYRNEVFYNLILGTDYHIDDYNVLTLSGNVAYEIEDQPSRTDYISYKDDVLTREWYREEETGAINPKWQYEFNYSKEFKNNKDHILLFSALGRFFGKELESEYTNVTTFGDDIDEDQEIDNEFFQSDYTFKLDYTNPITDEYTIETGAQYVINDVGNDFIVSNFNNGEFKVVDSLSNEFDYNQKVLGVYGTGAYQSDTWGLKLGLRMEATDLETYLKDENERDTQNFANWFPTAHTSYKFSDDFSLQAGYSKRIYRPRLWDLNPFISIRDNYNRRSGNPDLMPEFTDSYELTSIYKIGKASMSTSVYYKYTTDVREYINIIEYDEDLEGDVTTSTPFNIGTNETVGIEINGKYTPVRWLTFNGDFNWNYFDREGEYLNQEFNFSNDNWSSRLNSKISFPWEIDMEITGNYRSTVQTLQGASSGYAFADIGLRKKMLKGKAVINLAVRDVFASRIQENIIDNDKTYRYSFGQRGRFLSLGFSYGFGKGEAMTYAGKSR